LTALRAPAGPVVMVDEAEMCSSRSTGDRPGRDHTVILRHLSLLFSEVVLCINKYRVSCVIGGRWISRIDHCALPRPQSPTEQQHKGYSLLPLIDVLRHQ
jgi:hypothetical protein